MRENRWMRDYGPIVLAGLITGIAAVVLTALGNPKNMGFCIACFERDIAGALGFHSAAKVQYLRPEIAGIVLGAMLAAIAAREFRAKAGSSPASRFLIGLFVMIGALVFLGCPLRMVIRLGGGDLTAVAGLLGFLAGILVGIAFLKKGFSLGRAYPVPAAEGAALPGIMVVLLVLLLAVPGLLHFSEEGPGSMRAFWGVSLIAGGLVGAAAQRSRLCMAGGLRDAFLLRDFRLLSGFLAIWLAVTVGNLIQGNYNLSALSQPIAHSQYLWSFLGMALAGWGSILLGGCPLRQLILAGEGNGDSAVTVLGMIVGAAVAHNFGLAGNADSVVDGTYVVGGTGTAGMITVALGFAVLLAVTLTHLPKKEGAK
ncbi:YedE family putative selenium transporter [uncultured Oscillibacter sp.]|uniref:YedE family putative selenium transporter n=1 Tax=uncultured Oscillibacter sp. TaxID=876091 RepID=UPI0026141268|nr:YedE family putative selenium transporter [uncultured Oscillibacter sp.]